MELIKSTTAQNITRKKDLNRKHFYKGLLSLFSIYFTMFCVYLSDHPLTLKDQYIYFMKNKEGSDEKLRSYSAEAFTLSILTLTAIAYGLNFEFFSRLKLILIVFALICGIECVLFAWTIQEDSYFLDLTNDLLFWLSQLTLSIFYTTFMATMINWNSRTKSIVIGSTYFLFTSIPMFV